MGSSTLSLQLQGFQPAIRQATVELVSQATGVKLTRKPFLDGSLVMKDLDPGDYEISVIHPALLTPIDVRKIKVFPQRPPTRVPIGVPEYLFKDTPIRDIPDADMAPIQQTAAAVSGRLGPIAAKAPGEVLRSADWNTLAGAVEELARAVGELARLAAPIGHAHPEIADKIDEVQDNLRGFSESFGKSLLELRREIEAGALRADLGKVLDLAQAPAATRTKLTDKLILIEQATQAEPLVFTGQIARFGGELLSEINALAEAQGDEADDFLARPEVRALTASASQYSKAGTQLKAESELGTYARTGAAISGSKLGRVIGR